MGASLITVRGLSCSAAHGLFPHQGSNLHLLYWQEDSLPLNHQGRAVFLYLKNVFGYHFISPGWLQSERQIITSVGKVLGKLARLDTAGRKRKWCSHFGNHSGISLKTQHRITMWPSNFTPRYIFKRSENTCLYKNFTQIFRVAFFLVARTRNNSNVWELTNVLIMCDISVQEVLFSSKKEQSTDKSCCMDGFWLMLSGGTRRTTHVSDTSDMLRPKPADPWRQNVAPAAGRGGEGGCWWVQSFSGGWWDVFSLTVVMVT